MPYPAYCLILLLLGFGCAADKTEPDREPAESEAPTAYETPVRPRAKSQVSERAAGRWRSVADANEVVAFGPASYTSYYLGEEVVAESLQWYDRCPESCGQPAGSARPCFVISSEYDVACYTIYRLTADSLELRLVGGRGNRLVYVREE